MSNTPVKSFEELTRRHGVRAMTPATVEVFVLALGDVIGHKSVLSASKMDKMTVGFVESLEKAEELVVKGIVINGESVPVLPLSTAAKKVTVSNAPPYLKDVELERILSRYGEIVSPIEKVPISSSSPLIKHVKSFRRSVHMIVPNNGELELTLRFKEYGIDHNVYISTDKMRCFKCGESSHRVRNCPRNQSAKNNVTPRNQSESLTPAKATGESAVEVKGAVGEAGEAGEGGAAEVKEAVGAVLEEMLEQVEQQVKKRNRKAKGKKTQAESSSDVTTEMMDISPPAGEPEAPKEKTTGSKDSVKKRKIESPTPEEKIETESDDSNDDEYSRSYIKYFLKETKYEKGVNIRKYFPDLRLFVKNCKEYMADNRFEDTEVYRLKKIIKKVNDVLRIEDG